MVAMCTHGAFHDLRTSVTDRVLRGADVAVLVCAPPAATPA